MNFSPFGGHFSPSLTNIHQFASKLSHDFPSSAQLEDISLTSRYTANGIPSFTQHHHAAAPQELLPPPNKNGNYLTPQNLYPPSKRPPYEQQSNFDFVPGRGLPGKSVENLDKKKGLDHPGWQNIGTGSSTMVDYLAQLPSNSIPLSLHEFLKYSAESLKKEAPINHHHHHQQPPHNTTGEHSLIHHNNGISGNCLTNLSGHHPAGGKKKKKKKQEKEKKPRPKPGEIRMSTALDGSTLYCCPECHMALPERDLLEQHLMGHNMERRFVCDICGAALKRKDHLTRHKQSHNPERPYVCSVCLKAFKRKEQLTLHFVIHSGEKRHVCTECGKGFYRKDHLRKHTRSHIARRVKAELSQQGIAPHGVGGNN